MAISEPHYKALRELSERGEFTPGGRLLEIGEANYYGDMRLSELINDIQGIVNDDDRRGLEWEVADAAKDETWGGWRTAKAIYKLLIQPSEVCSIDMDGTPAAKKYDLNQQCLPNPTFDVVINHGTAEHIFNIANVFRLTHDSCKVGGLMIHESPFTGWVDHGFYTLQPTLFFDLTFANSYDIRYVAIEHIERKLLLEVKTREEVHELSREGLIPNNAMLYVAMRRTSADEFKIPMQGVYAKNVSPQAVEAWRSLR